MAIPGFSGPAAAKASLAALSKVSATAFVLTLGTAIIAVVAGAMLVAQMVDLEASGKKPPKSSQA